VKWQGTGKKEIRGKWKVPVVLASAHTNKGVAEVFEKIAKYREIMTANGGLVEKRRQQGVYWMWKGMQEMMRARMQTDAELKRKADELDSALVEARITPRNAAMQLMDAFMGGVRGGNSNESV
jgi:putative protein kinase ArgK-like GTPase of G3E family